MKFYFLGRKQIARITIVVLFLILTGLTVAELDSSKKSEVSSVKPPVIFRGNTSENNIALTFNVDWGEKEIPQILNILEEKQVKATFFLSGRWVSKNPELSQKIAKKGHEIGNHGYSHLHVGELKKSQIINEIKKAEKYINETTGVTPKLYAPPYGEKEKHIYEAASQIGYRTVYWTIDTIDWKEGRTAEIIAEKVIKKTQNGAIVLMHPRSNTINALPKIIAEVRKKGFNFKTVSETLQ